MTCKTGHKTGNTTLKNLPNWFVVTFYVFIFFLLSSCTISNTPPTSTIVLPSPIPTGQSAGIIPAAQQTPTQPTRIELRDFYTEPMRIDAGECTTIYWDVFGTKEGVYMNGELVPPTGSKIHCTCRDELFYLWAVRPDGTKTSSFVTHVEINEGTSCQLDRNKTPEAPQVFEPPVEPTVDLRNVFSNHTLTWEDCKFFGKITISHPSGIAQAKFGYDLNNQGFKWVWMSSTDGKTWKSDIGITVLSDISTPTGYIAYQFWAKDTLGNEIYTNTFPYDYTGCSG